MGNSASVSRVAATTNHATSQTKKRALNVIKANLKFQQSKLVNEDQQILNESPELKDELKSIADTTKEMYDLLDIDKNSNSMNFSTAQKLEKIYGLYAKHNHKDHHRIIGDKLADCNVGPLLIEYINILSSRGKEFPVKDEENYEYACYAITTGICGNVTDASSKFSKHLCKCGIIPTMLETLVYFQNDITHESRDDITESAMTILHNCAETDENKEYFYNEPKMVEVIAWYAQNTSQKDNRDLALLSAITLARIVEDKNNDVILADETIIQSIVQLLAESLDEEDHRAEGYSAKELTSGLARLANNGENSAIIMKYGILDYLRVMLSTGDDFEKANAAEAVWILAFSSENRQQIRADSKIISALKTIESSKTKSRKLNQSVIGALFMLSSHSDSTKKLTEQKKESMEKQEMIKLAETPKGHIMISYQWDYQDLMVEIKDRLEEDGYNVWIDLEEMGGSTLQAMAEAVENSATILICVCRKYKDSTNCRTEADYAYTRRKPVIPLKVENNYDPDGWLAVHVKSFASPTKLVNFGWEKSKNKHGCLCSVALSAIIGSKYYYNFTDPSKFDLEYAKLTKQMGETGKTVQCTSVTELDAPPPIRREQTRQFTDINSWTSSDVSSWSKQNGIKNLKAKNLDGKVLLFLQKMQNRAPEFFFRCASDQLGLKDVRELMLFTEALSELK